MWPTVPAGHTPGTSQTGPPVDLTVILLVVKECSDEVKDVFEEMDDQCQRGSVTI